MKKPMNAQEFQFQDRNYLYLKPRNLESNVPTHFHVFMKYTMYKQMSWIEAIKLATSNIEVNAFVTEVYNKGGAT